jgi:hypothetical protein
MIQYSFSNRKAHALSTYSSRRISTLQILLEAGHAKDGMIGVTQPRRVVSSSCQQQQTALLQSRGTRPSHLHQTPRLNIDTCNC